jgi:hypothetical protein
MKNFFEKIFHAGIKDEKADLVLVTVNKMATKIDDLSDKIYKKEQSVTSLNPNRRFYLEEGEWSYFDKKYTTYIAIRDRQHPSYQSGRNDITYEHKDVVFYVKSEFTGNCRFTSYYTPPENIAKAREVENHLDALEKLGVVSHFVVKNNDSKEEASI